MDSYKSGRIRNLHKSSPSLDSNAGAEEILSAEENIQLASQSISKSSLKSGFEKTPGERRLSSNSRSRVSPQRKSVASLRTKEEEETSESNTEPLPSPYFQSSADISAMTGGPPPKATRPTAGHTQPSTTDSDFDLRPPPPKIKAPNLETLTELLYCEEYLRVLTSDSQLLRRFSTFLNKYRPELARFVPEYLEVQKVLKAVDYANAVAASLVSSQETALESTYPAVEISATFLEISKRAFNALLQQALPAWVTYSLVKTATSCLAAEMTGHATPLTKDLFGGLSEVFCISDPNQPDNPLVYVSEEFFRLSGYNRDNVIGQNCRFLQGPRTNRECKRRLRKAISAGQEICETLLNYRRDGTPFVNVLLLAPLHDGKGKVKYYLGAQVDASRLVEGGRGVDGFERFLLRRELELERLSEETDPKEEVFAKLRDLGKAFDLEESAIVQDIHQGGSGSSDLVKEFSGSPSRAAKVRRVIKDEDEASGSESEKEDTSPTMSSDTAWKLSSNASSGRLPGAIYQKYVLIRPYPSLRMIFVSQSARKLGQLQQRPFLSYIAAPAATLSGLQDSLQSGTAVTAKVAVLSRPGTGRDGTVTGRWGKKSRRGEPSAELDPARLGKTCWISATPLLDINGNVGVWMVVIIEKGSAEINFAYDMSLMDDTSTSPASFPKRGEGKPMESDEKNLPLKPKRVGIQESSACIPTDLKPANKLQGAAPPDSTDAEDAETADIESYGDKEMRNPPPKLESEKSNPSQPLCHQISVP